MHISKKTLSALLILSLDYGERLEKEPSVFHSFSISEINHKDMITNFKVGNTDSK